MIGKLAVIGYRSLRHPKFFGLLTEADVKILLDVRRNPYSPNPDYQKVAIAEAAPAFGVHYFHVPALGVPGAGKSPIPPGDPTTFAEQMATDEAKRRIEKIAGILERGQSVALMCSEPNYIDCHRSQLVEIIQERVPGVELLMLTGADDQRLF